MANVSRAVEKAVATALGPDNLPAFQPTITPEEALLEAEQIAKRQLEEADVKAAPAAPVTTPTGEILVMTYEVTVDAVIGNVEVAGVGPGLLKGIVTDADIEAAGVDKAWLLKNGTLVEKGFARATG